MGVGGDGVDGYPVVGRWSGWVGVGGDGVDGWV